MTLRVDLNKPARALLATVALACAIVMLVPRPALAAPSAYWRLSSSSAPTNLAPGQEGTVIAIATNAGDSTDSVTKTSPTTITDVLPAGLTITQVHGFLSNSPGNTAFTCSQ